MVHLCSGLLGFFAKTHISKKYTIFLKIMQATRAWRVGCHRDRSQLPRFQNLVIVLGNGMALDGKFQMI